jgi:CRISPR-associated protein Cas2
VAVTVVITYDVCDDRRRTRVSHLLQSYGQRIQRSVFVCCLEQATLSQLRTRLNRMIDPGTDAIHVFRQCRSCWEGAGLHGQAAPQHDPAYWAVL